MFFRSYGTVRTDQTTAVKGGGLHLSLDKRSTRVLTAALILVAVYLVCESVILLSYRPDQWIRVPSNVVALVVCLATCVPLRRGNGHAAVSALTHGGVIWMALAATLGGGLQSPVMVALPLVVVVAGMLLGRRIGLRFVRLGVMLLVALFGAQVLGWLPEAPALPVPMVLCVQVMVVGVAYVMTMFAVDAHARRLQRIQKLNEELENAHREFFTLAEHLPALVVRTDLDFKCTFANHIFLEYGRLRSDQVIGRPLKHSLSAEQFELFERVAPVALEGRQANFLTPHRRHDEPRILDVTVVGERDASGKPTGLLAVAYDVTEREQLAVEMHRAATHDPLTGVANRLQIDTDAESAIERAKRSESRFAMLMIDLDGFKPINDTYGHPAGDHVLRHVAGQLRRSVRAADVVGRIGGDEFVVVCEGIKDEVDILSLAEKLLVTVREPTQFEDRDLTVGASVGIAIFPDHACSVRDLFQTADSAMYDAKRAGKNCVRIAGGATATRQ